jgi:eukaryotic-like serine/threonine-protein kinase
MSAETPSTSPNGGKGASVPPGDAAADGAKVDLPRTFGRYVLFDLIGKGGMAEIYLAKARTTEAGGSRLVVVKQILAELSENARFAEAFVQEAKLAARLSHANVVQVLDLGRAPVAKGARDGDAATARLFITMEYVEGLDLNELLRRCARAKVPLPIEFALLIVMETLRGLDYAHRRTDDAGKPLGIVHRDVSPSNVLVSVDGEIKLCDFGIARAMMGGDRMRASTEDTAMPADAIQGKAGYMSPEHARGEPLDARADVFAAGVILWELLAGRRLYRVKNEPGTKPESLLMVARRAEIPDVPGRGLPYEEELHAIVGRALAVQRDRRYEAAATMLAALQAYVAKARLVASPIRLGEWLTQHFGGELVETRRARERAVKALEMGPAATVTPAAPAASPVVAAAKPSTAVATVAAPEPAARVPPALQRVPTDASRVTDEPMSAPVRPKPKSNTLLVALLLLVVALAVAGYLLTRG